MQFSRQAMAVTAAALLVSFVSGFGVNPLLKSSVSKLSRVVLNGIRCEQKYYQLEEKEDKESCTTELFLLEDGGIEFGQTDGPVWEAANGFWEVKPGTDDFMMNIKRTYSSGRKGTDMGEFSFVVARTFVGQMTEIGDHVAIDGVMHMQTPDSEGERGEGKEIGYFNMIDGTDDRAERRADARVSPKAQSDTATAPLIASDFANRGQQTAPAPAPAAQSWGQPQYPQVPAPAPQEAWPQYNQAPPAPAPAQSGGGWSGQGWSGQQQQAPAAAPAPAPAQQGWSGSGWSGQQQSAPAPAPAQQAWSGQGWAGQQQQQPPQQQQQGYDPYGQQQQQQQQQPGYDQNGQPQQQNPLGYDQYGQPQQDQPQQGNNDPSARW